MLTRVGPSSLAQSSACSAQMFLNGSGIGVSLAFEVSGGGAVAVGESFPHAEAAKHAARKNSGRIFTIGVPTAPLA